MTYNHIAITGTIKKEPEFKSTPTGMNYCKFVLNVDAGFVGKDGERIEKTNYFPVTLWSKTCEEARSKLGIGSYILVSGSLKQESWKDKDGKSQSMTAINGTNVLYFDDLKQLSKSSTQKVIDAFPGKVKDGIDLPDENPF